MFTINITVNCRVLFIFAVSDGFSFFQDIPLIELALVVPTNVIFYPTEEISFVRCSQSKLSLSGTCQCRNVQALSLCLLVLLSIFPFFSPDNFSKCYLQPAIYKCIPFVLISPENLCSVWLEASRLADIDVNYLFVS